MSPAIPLPTFISVSASLMRRSFAAFSSYMATNSGFRRRACSSTMSIFLFAASALTGMPRYSAAAML